jgi:hypothetical protein
MFKIVTGRRNKYRNGILGSRELVTGATGALPTADADIYMCASLNVIDHGTKVVVCFLDNIHRLLLVLTATFQGIALPPSSGESHL